VLGNLPANSPERYAIAAGRVGAARGGPDLVLGGGPAVGPKRGQVDPELRGQRPHTGKRAGPATAPVPLRGDFDEGVAHRGRCPLGNEDAGHLPGHGRRNLNDGLVGLDLDERLVTGDRVALPNQPSDDLGAGEPLSQVREADQVQLAQKRRTSSSAPTTLSVLGM
jgi:hypothetical protein